MSSYEDSHERSCKSIFWRFSRDTSPNGFADGFDSFALSISWNSLMDMNWYATKRWKINCFTLSRSFSLYEYLVVITEDENETFSCGDAIINKMTTVNNNLFVRLPHFSNCLSLAQTSPWWQSLMVRATRAQVDKSEPRPSAQKGPKISP